VKAGTGDVQRDDRVGDRSFGGNVLPVSAAVFALVRRMTRAIEAGTKLTNGRGNVQTVLIAEINS
jgi:hypothetical protein